MSGRPHAAPGGVWPWPARLPPMILGYGAAVLSVLAVERFLHSATSAGYAAFAVVPGGLAAGIAAFALSFAPRARLLVLAATVIVALLPLGVIALSFDFREYRLLFEQRAALIAPLLALSVGLATLGLIALGVFPPRQGASS